MARRVERVEPLPTAIGTREAILATALRMFEERGYDGTSLREIAEAIGTTKAAVYYHFPAKEHLLLELTRPVLDGMSDLAARMRVEESTFNAQRALEAYLDLFIDHLPVVGLLARDPATQHHPDIGLRVRNLADEIRRQVAGAEPTAEQRVHATCAMWAISAVSTLTPAEAAAQRHTILAAAMAALSPS